MRARRVAGRITAGALAGVAGALLAAARPRPVPSERAAPDPPPGLPPARLEAIPGHGELFFRDTGHDDEPRPTVVLLHGWMFPADLNWSTCYGPLGAFARVLAPDARGHGRGTRPAEPFRLADVADDVAALLRHLELSPAVVVGYSMGGAVAQLLWRRHPDVVAGLVLSATSGSFNRHPRERWIWRGMGVLQVGWRLMPRYWWERGLARQVRGELPFRLSRVITDELPDDIVGRLPWIVGEMARGSAEDLAEAGRELGRFDATAWLADIDVPTAVVVTARDRLVSPDGQRELAQALPRAHVYEVVCDHNGVGAAAGDYVPTLVKAVQQVLQDAAPSTPAS
jgi:pimeloyl-ACP methyl ester carboxylesterase